MFTTFDLLDDVLALRDMVDRFFDEVSTTRRRVEYPYINVYEKDDDIIVRAIAPGVSSSDVNVQLADNTLTIEMNRKEDYADKPYLRKEREFGTYKKSIKLPYYVDPDKVEASMQNGILTIKLTKHESVKPRKITIN
ncbi:MAG: Hsp20/alpha crystallin family protein [Spirochaetes bacterium]|nr:Hsp20/alpha crystallin family protein [Spirochaetota bacterium]